jgi:hypothetical protein
MVRLANPKPTSIAGWHDRCLKIPVQLQVGQGTGILVDFSMTGK